MIIFHHTGNLFDTLTEDLELVLCACDGQFYDGVDHGSDSLLDLQEFMAPKCQVSVDIFQP